mgnify:FL=1
MNKSVSKGLVGQNYFQHFVHEKLNCIYHTINQESDFGIDGYIELKQNDIVTGKMVGVQIKYGNSFFENDTNYGYKFVGENKHLNYYLNSTVPVFIIIMDDKFERMNWVKFEISKTMPVGLNHWSIEVLKENNLETNFLQAIFDACTPIVDYEEEIEKNWFINTLLQNTKNRIIAIRKSDIENNNFDEIKHFLKNLCFNKEVLINSAASLDIFFPEYSNDAREIFDIPEIMMWLKNSIDIGIPWFYFLNFKMKNNGLNLLVHSYCREPKFLNKNGNMYFMKYDEILFSKFLLKNFDNLNKFIDKYNIDESINEKISEGIEKYFKQYEI